MNTDAARQITIDGLDVDIVRKSIKNLHLGVYPPDGRVRVAAPLLVSDEAVRLAVIGKWGWIKRQRARLVAQPRQSEREMVSGESHYFLGQRYRLRIVPRNGAARIVVKHRYLELHIRSDASRDQRERVLQEWYREQLKRMVPPLLEKWEGVLNVEAAAWGVKRMKTKWGACNIAARRVWLNLELAKKPAASLEYVLVHELVHLKERHHNDTFRALLDEFLPSWRQRRDELNQLPLRHEHW